MGSWREVLLMLRGSVDCRADGEMGASNQDKCTVHAMADCQQGLVVCLQHSYLDAVIYQHSSRRPLCSCSLSPAAKMPTQDKDFFLHLEMHMRQENPPLAGRDHMAYRSAYFPVREVVDGDLCSQYAALPPSKQQAIAAELDRTPGEVLKKLEERRNAII